MKKVFFFLIVINILFFSVQAVAQEKQKITVEWIYSPDAASITKLPSYKWLEKGRAIYFDSRKPAEERKMEIFDPKNLSFTPLLDMKKAYASLKNNLGINTPESLPFPTGFNSDGTKAFYIFNGDVYLLDIQTAEFEKITDTKEEEKNINFSPDDTKLAYVRVSDIYVYDIKLKKETRLTFDGSETILNGTLDWTYWEEIFGRADIAYWWAPDSKSIAFFQTDESPVGIVYYSDFEPAVPRVIKQYYAKTGHANPIVKLGVVETENAKITWADMSQNPYEYLVRIKWHPNSKQVTLQSLNRKQDQLDMFLVNRTDGKVKHILKETDPGWVNLHDDLTFIKEGKEFIWMSERTGYAHLYRYSIDGQLINQITKGEWAVASAGGSAYWVRQSVAAVDEKNELIYFGAQEKSAKEKHIYSVKYDGTSFKRITDKDGTHRASFSNDAKYFIDTYSSLNLPPSLRLFSSDGTLLRELAKSDEQKLANLDLEKPVQFTIKARDGFDLPAEILKPKSFDSNKKYPLIVFIYGGPSAPSVKNDWGGQALFYNQVLVDNGYLVGIIDNRGATAISKTLENMIFNGSKINVELNDLVDAVKWLKKQSYVDSNRVGVWGWSGGGTNTLNAMTGSKEFNAGIAVAAVTDWRFYDTRFGELGMKRTDDNVAVNENPSLVQRAKDLHGRLMLVHGSYDDNVHIQNMYAFANQLIKENIMFDMMVYPMRKHGITDRPARIHLYNTMLEFWKKNL